MSNPSPVCTVKDGAGSPQTVTSAYATVTPGNTVTIQLADLAGVNIWSLTCVGADETTDAASITSGLSINSTTKTATFTAPAAGKALLFKSVVNDGVGIDEQIDESLSTTFKIATLTTRGGVVVAVGEEMEHDATYGWAAILNDSLRTAEAAGGGYSTVFEIDFTAQSNQNLMTGGDGTKTIGGSQFTLSLTANLASADVVNGTGIVLVNGSNGFAGFAFKAVVSTIAPTLDPFSSDEELEISWQWTVSAMAGAGEYVFQKWGDNSVGLRLAVGTEYAASVMKKFFMYSDPPGSSTSSVLNESTVNVSDDVHVIRVLNGTYGEVWSGTYGTSWPREMKLRGYRTHATQTDTWIGIGHTSYTSIEYSNTPVSTGRTITIKRLRIRKR